MDRTSNRLQRIAIPVQNIFARESSHQLQSLVEMTEFDRNHLETKHLVCIFFKSKPHIIQVGERLAQRDTQGLGRYKIGLPGGLPFIADQFVSLTF